MNEEKRKEIILLGEAKFEGQFSQVIYHYGFGNPNCPNEMHHHHDINCPDDCTG